MALDDADRHCPLRAVRRGVRPAGRAALAVWLLATTGCAPLAAWRGPRPASGAIPAEAARVDPAAADSLVALVYGDNRSGYRMQTHSTEFGAVRGLAKGPRHWPIGLALVPLFLIEAIVPSLDGPRDAVTMLTRRPSGGGERGVLRALEKAGPADLVISTGDVVADGRRSRQWEDFLARHRALRERVPYRAAPGNHERLWDPVARGNWDVAMGAPRARERYWYAVDVPRASARFLFLETDLLADVHNDYPDSLERALADQQLAWADSMMALPARYRFVVQHHPLVSAGHYLHDWAPDSAGDPVPGRRERLLELCAAHRVTAVLAGHEHLYHRAFVADRRGGGFWHVTLGGGGAPLHRVSSRERRASLAQPMPSGLSLDPARSYQRTVYHFARLVLPCGGDRAARLEVYRVPWRGPVVRLDQLVLEPSRKAR